MASSAAKWIDGRATLLALVLAVAATLPLIFTGSIRRDFFFFDVTLLSDTSGLTRFSWDSGSGFSERESSAQPLRQATRGAVYRFLVPSGTFGRFRFSPLDRPGQVNVSKAQLVTADGRVLKVFDSTDFRGGNAVEAMTAVASERYKVLPSEAEPFLELPLSSPVTLAVTPWMKLKPALPLGSFVFLIGLLLASPRLTEKGRASFSGLWSWALTKPVRTLLLTAAVGVTTQAHPVIFAGRSFVSPNNGAMMLYGRHPTLPGATQATFADTMGSDVGAILFCHLYYSMAVRDALMNGELPLWNRYSLTGVPLLGQGQSLAGDPFNLLTIAANGRAWAWDVHFLITRWLLAAGIGWCVWRLTRHLPATLLTTLASAFLGFFTFRINHPANFSLGYAPWILAAWIGLIQAAGARQVLGWLGLLLAANWTEFSSGTIKEATMLMVCLNFAGLLLLFFLPGSLRRRFTLAGLAAGTGLIFLLLSAPLWLSFASSLSRSFTAYAAPQAQVFSLRQIIGLFDDIFYRQNTAEEWVVGPSLNGIFLLGVVTWAVAPNVWKRDRAGLALLAASLGPLALAFGIVPPSLIVRLPFLANVWHIGNTFSCPLLILLAVLGGCGLSRASSVMASPQWRWRCTAAAAVVGLLVMLFFSEKLGHATSVFFRGYAIASGLALVALTTGWYWATRSGGKNALLVSLVLGLPILCWRHAQYSQTPFNHYAFSPGERTDFYASSPAAKRVTQAKANEVPSRVIGLQNNLFPSFNTLLRWEGLYGVDALRNPYYIELANALGLGRVVDWNSGTPDADVASLQRAHDFLNVAYVLADHRSPAFASPGLEPLAQLDLDVSRSPAAWPRAFFTDAIFSYNKIEEFTTRLRESDGRPFAAVQQGDIGLPAITPRATLRAVVPAHDFHLTSNTTSFEVDAPGPGVVVLTEAYYPKDFRATIDGTSVNYFRVNHAFKGVKIEQAGRHRISFTYWPEPLTLSLWTSATGALASIVSVISWIVWAEKKKWIPAPSSA